MYRYRDIARERNIGNKKGSYMMEASIVLPMLILAVITSVLIIMFFYMSVIEQCGLHMALRCEAGAATGRTAYIGENEADTDGDIDIERGLTETVARGEATVMLSDKVLLKKRPKLVIEGEWHGTDGADYVRRLGVMKGIADER